jgi:Tfp pilus assembly protein PilZ
VELALQLPEIETVLRVEGRVAWTYDIRRSNSQIMTGTGIKFEDMTPEKLQVLEWYLLRVAPREVRARRAAATAPPPA